MTRKTNTITLHPSEGRQGAKVNKIHVSETYGREILFVWCRSEEGATLGFLESYENLRCLKVFLMTVY